VLVIDFKNIENTVINTVRDLGLSKIKIFKKSDLIEIIPNTEYELPISEYESNSLRVIVDGGVEMFSYADNGIIEILPNRFKFKESKYYNFIDVIVKEKY